MTWLIIAAAIAYQEAPPKAEAAFVEAAARLADKGLYGDAERKLRPLKGPIGRAAWALAVSEEDEVARGRGLEKFYPERAEAILRELRPELEHLAERDPEAMSILGRMYVWGAGVEADPEKGFAFTKRSAEGGRTLSMNNLSIMYRDGAGTARDLKRALQWARKASDAGSLAGRCGLAECYRDGVGVKKDVTKALQLYRSAAEAGSVDAMWAVAHIANDRRNDAVAKGDTKAAGVYQREMNRWLTKASQLGDAEAAKALELGSKIAGSLKLQGDLEDLMKPLPGSRTAPPPVFDVPPETPARIRVLGRSQQLSESGNYISITVEAQNIGLAPLKSVMAKVVLRDAGGRALKTETIYFGDFESGQSRVGETSIRADLNFARYDLEFQTVLGGSIRHTEGQGPAPLRRRGRGGR